MTLKTNKIIITNPEATETDVLMESSGAGNIDINKVLKLSSDSAYAAAGSQSMKFTEGSSLGPNAATGGDVAKWLTVQDGNGSTLYIPAFE